MAEDYTVLFVWCFREAFLSNFKSLICRGDHELQEEEGAHKKQAAAKAKKANKRRSKSKAAADPIPEAMPACSASDSWMEKCAVISADRGSGSAGIAAGDLGFDKLAPDKPTASAVNTGQDRKVSAATKPVHPYPHWMLCRLTKVCFKELTLRTSFPTQLNNQGAS